jgi:hypothetical protein
VSNRLRLRDHLDNGGPGRGVPGTRIVATAWRAWGGEDKPGGGRLLAATVIPAPGTPAPGAPAPGTIGTGRAALRALLSRLLQAGVLPPVRSGSLPAVPTDPPAAASARQARIALFCGSVLVAFGALPEAQANGVAVPERRAVCGAGDFELGSTSDPPFMTTSVEGARIGRDAARLLLDRLDGATPPPRVQVPFRIVERASSWSGRGGPPMLSLPSMVSRDAGGVKGGGRALALTRQIGATAPRQSASHGDL